MNPSLFIDPQGPLVFSPHSFKSKKKKKKFSFSGLKPIDLLCGRPMDPVDRDSSYWALFCNGHIYDRLGVGQLGIRAGRPRTIRWELFAYKKCFFLLKKLLNFGGLLRPRESNFSRAFVKGL